MNAGKLVAQLAVLGIVAYCCYGAIVTSLPTSMDELKEISSNPFDVTAPELSGNCNGVEFVMQMSGGKIISHLPASIDDVYVTIYVGSGDVKLNLGTIDLGSLEPGKDTQLTGTVRAPIYAILAYSVVAGEEDSATMTIPLCLKVGFKYFEWQGVHLIDLGVTLKNDMPIQGTSVAPKVEGVNASVKVTLDPSKGGILEDAANGLNQLKSTYPTMFDSEGNIALKFGSSGEELIKINVNTDGPQPIIDFKALGQGDKTAADLIKDCVDSEGKLKISLEGYEGAIEPLSAENTETFIEILNMLYDPQGALA